MSGQKSRLHPGSFRLGSFPRAPTVLLVALLVHAAAAAQEVRIAEVGANWKAYVQDASSEDENWGVYTWQVTLRNGGDSGAVVGVEVLLVDEQGITVGSHRESGLDLPPATERLFAGELQVPARMAPTVKGVKAVLFDPPGATEEPEALPDPQPDSGVPDERPGDRSSDDDRPAPAELDPRTPLVSRSEARRLAVRLTSTQREVSVSRPSDPTGTTEVRSARKLTVTATPDRSTVVVQFLSSIAGPGKDEHHLSVTVFGSTSLLNTTSPLGVMMRDADEGTWSSVSLPNVRAGNAGQADVVELIYDIETIERIRAMLEASALRLRLPAREPLERLFGPDVPGVAEFLEVVDAELALKR